METKDKTYITALVLIAVTMAGLQVYDTGNELVCRTNKPIGWEITADHEGYVEAVCPYTTKEPVTADCRPEFRSTGSYENYGCAEVAIYIPDSPGPTTPSKPAFTCKAESLGGCT